jgi:predicted amino acid dehydrogenase
VGVPAAHLLAAAGFELILVGRTAEAARELLGDLADRATFSGHIGSAGSADITVMLTSDPSVRMQPELFRRGSVIIDFAQPATPATAAQEGYRQREIAVVPGGIVRIPGYTCDHDYGLGAPDVTLACVAETYLFAREGIRQHSVGRPSPELARRLERAARRLGVVPRPLGLGGAQPAAEGVAAAAAAVP